MAHVGRRRAKPAHALPPPFHKRKLVWAGAALVAVVVAVVFASSTDNGGVGDGTATVTTQSTTTTTAPVDCIAVANPSLLITIDATEASAVTIADGWFVSKADGATWYTTADPRRDAEGELLPMNDRARADSESRRDVPAGSPLYKGHSDDEAEAVASRSCAAAS